MKIVIDPPVNRNEMYLASAAGEFDGDLPEPVTREEKYLVKIIERIDGFENIDPDDIEVAIENYPSKINLLIIDQQIQILNIRFNFKK